MYLFRGEAPIAEMAATFPPPLRLGLQARRRSGSSSSYPFEEAYFLPYARQFRAALDMPLILLGGINRLDTVQRALAEGFEFVADGPRAPARARPRRRAGRRATQHEGLCIHCNKCMPTIYRGTHCVLVAPDDRPGRRRT